MAAWLDKIKGIRRRKEEIGAGEMKTVPVSKDAEKESAASFLRGIMQDKMSRNLVLIAVAAALLLVLVFWFYNRIHHFTQYRTVRTTQEEDIDGTQYAMLGKTLIKYSTDGLFASDTAGNIRWSLAYSMQTPISVQRGRRMAVAEQQGRQVVIIGENGAVGQFETRFPIRKLALSSGGVTAAVEEDGDVTWIRMYSQAGEELVAVKTTLEESGYPLDIDITSDAKRMMVSYLCEENGELSSRICFYDFSSSQDSEEDHLTAEQSYSRIVFPDVYYTDNNTPVAVGDCGCAVFGRGRRPEEKVWIEETREIVSAVYDSDYIGFIFRSGESDRKYDMEVRNYKGKTVMTAGFDFEYTGARMENGEILLYDSRNLYICRMSGKWKLSVTYDKPVVYFTALSGIRRYLVVTDECMDVIRLV